MLQFPTNVRPDNIGFDVNSSHAEDRRFSFKFKGDFMMAYAIRIFDYETGELACNDRLYYDYKQATMAFQNMAYNNDNIIDDNVFTGVIPNGGRYVMQLLIVSGTSDTAGWLADNFIGRGTIQADYTAGDTTVSLEKGINDIYKWDLDLENTGERKQLQETVHVTSVTPNTDITYPITVMEIKINGERKLITKYNYETGVATIRSTNRSFPKGTPYELYANYVISEQYLFRTESAPTVTGTGVTWYATGFKFTAHYNQIQSIPMKYYTIKLQQVRNSTYYTIKTTERIYSQKIEYRFTDDYNMQGMGGNYDTRQYRFIVDVMMQDGIQYQFISPVYTQPERTGEAIDSVTVRNTNGSSDNSVSVGWNTTTQDSVGYKVYRQEINDNPVTWFAKTLVADIGAYGGFYDLTIPQKGTFRYMVVPYENTVSYEGIENATGVYESILTPNFTTNMEGYTITSIIDTGYEADSLPLFAVGETYKFEVDVECGAITQNTDKTLHVGYGKYSSLTSTKTEYLSGSLSGLLGYMQCSNGKNEYIDDIERVKLWRKFITQDCQYILRTPKGDVFVVNIVDNPTTEYLNEQGCPTKFSFDWAECADINEILLCSSNNVGVYPPTAHKRSD